MNETLMLVLSWAAGGGLGALFFGGLWWTVRRAAGSKWAPLWFPVSLLFRSALALAGFYAVSAGHLDRLALCLLGFVMARLAAARLARRGIAP